MKTRVLLPVVLAFALLASACGATDAETAADTSGETADNSADTAEVQPEQPTEEPDPSPEPDPTPEPEPEPESDPSPEPEPEPAEEAAAESSTPAGALASGCGAGVAPGITTAGLEFEGQQRVYEQVIPASYDDSNPMPVVLNWHGLGSNGVEQVGFSDYVDLADAEGFIVIAPTGLPDATDRNSWELAPEQFPERDDLAFANTLLDQVIETLCVDEARVYTTGMSNGGYFSSVLVCNMSDRIAAAASVAALSHPDDCDPARVVPYIGFHGTEDDVVPYDGGGESSLAPGVTVPLFELKILDEFTEFAVAAGCDTEPIVTAASENVTSFDFSNCVDDVDMTFYEIAGAGHTWPGSAVSLALSEALGLGVTTDEISASETSWAFFEQYSLDS